MDTEPRMCVYTTRSRAHGLVVRGESPVQRVQANGTKSRSYKRSVANTFRTPARDTYTLAEERERARPHLQVGGKVFIGLERVHEQRYTDIRYTRTFAGAVFRRCALSRLWWFQRLFRREFLIRDNWPRDWTSWLQSGWVQSLTTATSWKFFRSQLFTNFF